MEQKHRLNTQDIQVSKYYFQDDGSLQPHAQYADIICLLLRSLP